jgi:hypothetical protein
MRKPGPSARRDVVVVFARYPGPGAVKTRLAQSIGASWASRLYRAFLSDLARNLDVAPFAVRWAVAPPDPGFAALVGVAGEACFVQEGEDLGERMHAAFVAMQAAGFERCLIVGSDMPQLLVSTLEHAFHRLRDADLVLGPADDGGYYLIGMSRPYDVFRGVRFSTASVLEETRRLAGRLGLRLAELAPAFDVDVAEDLSRLRRLLDEPELRAELPATAAALEALVAAGRTS